MSTEDTTNVLLIYPKNPVTFWSFDESLKMVDKQSAFPPLGLLTIAGMCPDDLELRMIDMNVHPLLDDDLIWADVVLTSSMIIHWHSLEEVISRCNRIGVPIMNGGPLPTQYHEEIEGDAVFYLGEAENGFIDEVRRLAADPEAGRRQTIDRRGEFKDLVKTPLPRWDLIDFDDYSNMVVQITRGCPESCTFCNIPSLYGKITRVKTKSRIIEELDALYDAGWRGSVMAVDDNFVGNREDIRVALEEDVIPWQKERKFPFQFHTQASIRVSDDPALLEAMYQAGFDKVFAGIESPVEESLKFMGARKNLQGDTPLLDKVKTLQKAGFEVQAGFIMGLDTDPDDIADRMLAFIREAGIPVAMVGILGVLRDTPDYKRFKRAGRLIENVKYTGDSGIFNRQLSYKPLMDPEVLIERHRSLVETLNSPEIFFERCATHYRNLGRTPVSTMPIGKTELLAFARSLWRQGVRGTYRATYWKFLLWTLGRYPLRFGDAIRLAVQGHHLILTTREALHVDEVKTFMEEAVERLESYCQGYREALRRTMGARADRIWQVVQARVEDYNDHRQALRHNAAVLVSTAQEYADSVRVEVRHQVHEPLERFQQEVNRLLDIYAQEEEAV